MIGFDAQSGSRRGEPFFRPECLDGDFGGRCDFLASFFPAGGRGFFVFLLSSGGSAGLGSGGAAGVPLASAPSVSPKIAVAIDRTSST